MEINLDRVRNAQLMAICPPAITPPIRDYCRQRWGREPEYVPIEPVIGCEVGRCYANVEAACTVGDEIVHGWSIYEQAFCWLFVMHHAVLRRANRLIDVTPELLPDDNRVLFVSDHFLPGVQSNRERTPYADYHPLTDDPRVLKALVLKRRHIPRLTDCLDPYDQYESSLVCQYLSDLRHARRKRRN